jgi:transposase
MHLSGALRRGGRQRNVPQRAREIQVALRSEQLTTATVISESYGAVVSAAVAVLGEMNRQLDRLQAELARNFEAHPDAKLLRSLPGLGTILGARVLGEFGDDPNRYADAKARRNYAGTSPVTVASGRRKVIKARFVGNRHLTDACYLWAFAALTGSPGARAYYDQLREKGNDHDAALRSLGNRLVGILDGCLRHRTLYNETIAWGHRHRADQSAA